VKLGMLDCKVVSRKKANRLKDRLGVILQLSVLEKLFSSAKDEVTEVSSLPNHSIGHYKGYEK
jgi:hypothetical protein